MNYIFKPQKYSKQQLVELNKINEFLSKFENTFPKDSLADTNINKENWKIHSEKIEKINADFKDDYLTAKQNNYKSILDKLVPALTDIIKSLQEVQTNCYTKANEINSRALQSSTFYNVEDGGTASYGPNVFEYKEGEETQMKKLLQDGTFWETKKQYYSEFMKALNSNLTGGKSKKVKRYSERKRGSSKKKRKSLKKKQGSKTRYLIKHHRNAVSRK